MHVNNIHILKALTFSQFERQKSRQSSRDFKLKAQTEIRWFEKNGTKRKQTKNTGKTQEQKGVEKVKNS